MRYNFFTFLTLSVIASFMNAQTLDSGFGTNGTFTSDLGFTDLYFQTGLSSHNDLLRCAVVGIHDGVITLGSFQMFDDGTVDTSIFPPDGINRVKPSDLGVSADDGFISNIVTNNAGESFGGGNVNLTATFLNGQHGLVSKTLATGATDQNYGNLQNGISVISSDQDEDRTLKFIALASDNSQMMTLNYFSPNDYSFLVKYDPAGNYDDTFGEVIIDYPSTFTSRTTTEHVAVLEDDSSIVAGYASTIDGIVPFLVKVDSSGSIVNSFGTNGFAGSEMTGGNDIYAWSVFAQPDGSLVVLITEEITSNNYEVKLAKFDSNGVLDTTFGGGSGVANLGVSWPTNLNFGNSFAIAQEDSNGDILFAYDNNLYKIDVSAASLDTNFGAGGVYTAADNISAVHTKDNGKIAFSGINSAGMYYVSQLIPDNLSVSTIDSVKERGLIYPVPVRDQLFIKAEANQYQIINSAGKLVAKGIYQNGIELSSLPSGVYFLQFTTANGEILNRKFIKE